MKIGDLVLTKVVAINGSPKMDKGKTTKMLTSFLDGMMKAGASVELFYARRDAEPSQQISPFNGSCPQESEWSHTR